MYHLFRKIEKATSSTIALSYIVMTLVIAFHIHTIDIEINPFAKVSNTGTNQEQVATVGFEKCAFIHQASNTVQFFQSDTKHVKDFTLVAIISYFQTNSHSFGKIHLSDLRAPPIFS